MHVFGSMFVGRGSGESLNPRPIRVIERSLCLLCGGPGKLIHQRLRDSIFSTPGEWGHRRCLDRSCGLIWLDPCPAEDEIAAIYRNYYTHEAESSEHSAGASTGARVKKLSARLDSSYLALRYGYESKEIARALKTLGWLAYLNPVRRLALDWKSMFLPACPGGRLLDIGCGNGEMLAHFKGLGWQVYGTDPDPAAVIRARERGLSVRLGDIREHEWAAGYFDAIVLHNAIEHLYRPLDTLRECHRLLRLGGRLALVTMNLESWGFRLYGENWIGLGVPHHLYLFGMESLQRAVRIAGFRILRAWSAAYGSNFYFEASEMVRRTGGFAMRAQPPLGLRIKSRLMQLAEWMLLLFRPESGEQMVVHASK